LIERTRGFQLLFWILAAIIFWLFVFRNLINSGTLAWGDFPLYPIQGAGALASRVIYAWQPVGLGFSDYTFPGRLVLSFLIALLRNDALLAHNVYYLSLLPLTWLSLYVSTIHVIESRLARGMAALLFVMNPVAIGQFSGGSPELLLSYALIPVVALCLEKLGHVNASLLVFWVSASAMVIAIGFSFYLSFLLVSIPLLVLPLVSSAQSGFKYLARLPVLVFLSFAFALLLTATLSFALLQSAIGSSTETLSALRPGNTIYSFLANIATTYRLAIPLSTLRLAGNLAASDFWLGYQTPGDPFNLAGFAIPLVAFAALLRKKSASAYALSVGVLALAIISYLFLIRTFGPPRWLFEHVPILVGARNPVPLMLVAAFAMSVLFGLSLDASLETDPAVRAQGHVFPRYALALTLVVGCLAIYGWPFFTGDMGTARLYGGSVSVSSVYYDIGAWLGAHQTDKSERVLLLPYDSGSRVAMGLMPLRVVEEQADRSQNRYADFVFDAIVKGQANNLGSLLAPLNVRYVVVNLDSRQEGAPNVYALYGPYLYGSAQEYQKTLDGQSDLHRVFASPDFLVYENSQRMGQVVFFADTNLFAAGQPIGPAQVNVVSPTEYRAPVPSQATAVLLSESFDSGWVASRDGCQLSRLENSYSMNAFLIPACPNARGELTIEYAPQRTRFVLLAILAAAWGIGLTVLLVRPARILFGRVSSAMAHRK